MGKAKDPKERLDEKIAEINPPYEPKKPEPSEPKQGDMRYDRETNGTKIYVGTNWVPVANSISKEENAKITEGALRGMSINTDPIVYSTTPSTTTGPIMTGGSGGWTSTGTTTTGIMVAPETAPVTQKKPDRKLVEFPRRVTKKVVIGFVEDDDEVVWSAKLKILDFHIDFDSIDGEGRITLVTDIEDTEA